MALIPKIISFEVMNYRFQVRVLGKSQGVFFRKTTAEKGNKLGLTGWVRNEPDGSVLFECQGMLEQCFPLISWAQSGPPMAEVEGLKIDQVTVIEGESGFSVQS